MLKQYAIYALADKSNNICLETDNLDEAISYINGHDGEDYVLVDSFNKILSSFPWEERRLEKVRLHNWRNRPDLDFDGNDRGMG